jgi:putative FmdB family regulatory protein
MWQDGHITHETDNWIYGLVPERRSNMIYTYKCEKCEREFDEEQRLSDPPLTQCDKCSGALSKIIPSAPTFVLKGSGWSKDGYK